MKLFTAIKTINIKVVEFNGGTDIINAGKPEKAGRIKWNLWTIEKKNYLLGL